MVDLQGIIGKGERLHLNIQKICGAALSFLILQRIFCITNIVIQVMSPKLHLFGQLRSICRQWMDNHLECIGNTYPAQLMYKQLADMAANKISAAITETHVGDQLVKGSS